MLLAGTSQFPSGLARLCLQALIQLQLALAVALEAKLNDEVVFLECRARGQLAAEAGESCAPIAPKITSKASAKAPAASGVSRPPSFPLSAKTCFLSMSNC